MKAGATCLILLVSFGCGEGGDDLRADADPDAGSEADAEVDAQIHPLELHSLGSVDLVAGQARLAFELPPDVRSLDLVLVEPTERHLLVVTDLRGPSGALVEATPAGWVPSDADFLLGPFPGAFYSPNRSVPIGAGVGALHAPNAPGVALVGGPWTLEIGAVDFATEAPGEGPVEVTAWVGRGPAPSSGVLPVHLFFSEFSGLTARTAQVDPDFQAALGHVAQALAPTLTLEVASWQDVEAPADVPAEGGPDSPLHALLRQNPHETGVAVFLVGRLVTPFGTEIAGVAGGTPGPALTPHTGRSGVVVASGLPPAALGRTMAHEIGHFLGLFHPLEAGRFPDPLPDTADDDPHNLMAVGLSDADPVLTPQQRAVLLSHPAVQRSPGGF